MRKTTILLASALLACTLLSVKAKAQSLDFTFSESLVSGSPGDTVSFTATLTNTNIGDPISLNSSNITLLTAAPGLTITDDFASTPLTLTPTTGVDPTWTGTLFTVAISPTAGFGSYSGSYEIDYADTLIYSSSYHSTQNFEVDVIPYVPPAHTPEPGNRLLLIAFVGSAILFVLCRDRNSAIRTKKNSAAP